MLLGQVSSPESDPAGRAWPDCEVSDPVGCPFCNREARASLRFTSLGFDVGGLNVS